MPLILKILINPGHPASDNRSMAGDRPPHYDEQDFLAVGAV